ncbi:MAG: prepilin-type N-terminal cleavage/methylation domain-containing protein [Desulfobacterales bacterium]|nr:prepilin-type N-terminal cleavage/methylation domain-containing protein [Desulfobacterales bacterium]
MHDLKNKFPIINYQFSDGFTLIETLVAMMILATSLVVILQLFSGGLKAGRLSDEYTRAVFHAKEKMEEILLTEELADGAAYGEFDADFKWRAEIRYIEPPEDSESEEKKKQAPVDMFRITVDVSWHEGNSEKHFEVSTLKIAKLIVEESK